MAIIATAVFIVDINLPILISKMRTIRPSKRGFSWAMEYVSGRPRTVRGFLSVLPRKDRFVSIAVELRLGRAGLSPRRLPSQSLNSLKQESEFVILRQLLKSLGDEIEPLSKKRG